MCARVCARVCVRACVRACVEGGFGRTVRLYGTKASNEERRAAECALCWRASSTVHAGPSVRSSTCTIVIGAYFTASTSTCTHA